MLAQGLAHFALLDALLEVGPEGATREHLVRKADISPTTFYKTVKPLLTAGLVREEGNRYRMPLEHAYNFRYKSWRDFDRLYELDERDRSAVLTVLDSAIRDLGEELYCLWLVGSAAQGQLRVASDLDFLALVRNADNQYLPRSHREVQWVPMDPSRLEQKLQDGDEFAVNAIRYGLLLLDRGAAQHFYTMPLRPPSGHFFRQKALTIERLRGRFFSALDTDVAEAREHLDSLAQTMARSIMQRFGESLAGKDELRKALAAYFGGTLAETFDPPTGRAGTRELVGLHRRLSECYGRITENAQHLEHTTAALLHGQPAEFEAAVSEVLAEILGPKAIKQPRGHDHGMGDIWLQMPKHPDLIAAMKSVAGRAHHSHLAQTLECVARYEETTGRPARAVLLINALRDVPMLERPPLTSKLVEEAEELSVHILTAERLVQAHHMLHVEGGPDQARDWLQLSRLDARKKPAELTTAVLDLEHKLYHLFLRIVAARGWLDQLKQLLQPTLVQSVEKLYWKSGEVMTERVKTSLEKFLEVHSQVARGEPMRKAQLLRALDLGLDAVKALESFPRGTMTVLDPQVQLFADAQGTMPRKHVHGVVLDVSGAGVPPIRVYPTTRTYERGQTLSLEWSFERACKESWYREKDGSLKHAWTESAEFVGRPLTDLDQVPVDDRRPARVLRLLSVQSSL